MWLLIVLAIGFIMWFDVQPPPRKIPRTIENTREADETVCRPDDEEVWFDMPSWICLFGLLHLPMF